jgi:non-homologous end joining protein Ku
MTHSIDPLPAADAAKEASPPTVDLMAALQASLEAARKAREARAAKKTASHNADEFIDAEDDE